jgi:hypothetical protein
MIDPLTRLTAIEEIKQLKARYFRLMDTRDWEGMSLTFCSDAVWDCSQGFQYTPLDGDPIGPVGPITKGRHAIIAWLKEALHGKATVHHGHCHEITIDGEGSAHGVIAMTDYIRKADRKTPLLVAAGHYHDLYLVEDGAWRISRTKLTRLFNDEH